MPAGGCRGEHIIHRRQPAAVCTAAGAAAQLLLPVQVLQVSPLVALARAKSCELPQASVCWMIAQWKHMNVGSASRTCTQAPEPLQHCNPRSCALSRFRTGPCPYRYDWRPPPLKVWNPVIRIPASKSVLPPCTGVSVRSCKAQISSRMPRAAVSHAPPLHQRSEVRRRV